VFEVVAVLRREVGRGRLPQARAATAVDTLGNLALELFPMLPLRRRAFELRHNLTAGAALFVALAEALGEPLATKDRGLARAAAEHSAAEVVLLG
jgi:predicted nucleic acid-binding protein